MSPAEEIDVPNHAPIPVERRLGKITTGSDGTRVPVTFVPQHPYYGSEATFASRFDLGGEFSSMGLMGLFQVVSEAARTHNLHIEQVAQAASIAGALAAPQASVQQR